MTILLVYTTGTYPHKCCTCTSRNICRVFMTALSNPNVQQQKDGDWTV